MIDLDVIEGLEPPGKPDFRRAGKGVPLVKNDAGKYERFRRSSSAGKVLDDEAGLNFWQICTTLIGAAQRPDILAQVSVLDYESDKAQIYELAEQCLVTGKGRQRQVTGTAIHAMLDRIDAGEDWTPAPQFEALCNAYVETVHNRYGLVPVDIECKCVNDEYRLAGTMDRRYRTTKILVAPDGTIIPIGSIIAGDTKTGRTLEYASGAYATQLAGYVDSVRYDVETDTRSEFDPPTFKEWAIVVHCVPEDARCEIHWVDLNAGRHGLALATQVYAWRRRSDLLTLARMPLHAVQETPGDSSAPTQPEQPITASNGVTAPSPDALPPVDLALVRSWLLDRLEAVRNAGVDAIGYLQRVWPVGVAGFKTGTHTEAELNLIADAISEVEKEFSLSFPVADPRAEFHASDRWAKPETTQPDNNADDQLRYVMANHPRYGLLQRWTSLALEDLDPSITDRIPLSHALYEFGLVNEGWSDEDLTEMLDGTLRAMGFEDGIRKLGHVRPEQCPVIMSAAFALTAETALLLYDESGRPIVRNIRTENMKG